mgnify:CR=1 FL=1
MSQVRTEVAAVGVHYMGHAQFVTKKNQLLAKITGGTHLAHTQLIAFADTEPAVGKRQR